ANEEIHVVKFDCISAVLVMEMSHDFGHPAGGFGYPTAFAQGDHRAEVAGKWTAETGIVVVDAIAQVIARSIAIHIQSIIGHPRQVIERNWQRTRRLHNHAVLITIPKARHISQRATAMDRIDELAERRFTLPFDAEID